jgi:eukaryotic-like serine/threonine-protein kinase
MQSSAIISNRMLQIGDTFDRYQIQGHLAQGGMSEIYRAFDMIKRQEVVLKLPDASMIGDPAQYERFQREMEVVRTLDHPAILRGLDAGRYNRTPYLVTEFVQGESLRKIIENSAPMPPEKAVELVIKIADGMAYCHQNDVVHRDLKPENILINTEGQPVIMDFGLALTKGSHRVTYSNLSATMGTPDYMAPEQIDGHRGDARTDIYALGTILFEMLAGRVPFVGDTQLAIMAQHVQGTAPRLDKLQAGVSPQLAAVVAKCLQRKPEERYADMHALIEALEHPESADLSLLDEKSSAGEGELPWWKSSSFKAVLIGAGILVVIVILAFALQTLRQ